MQEPTILVAPYEDADSKAINENSYKGLRIHALPGLHDYVEKLALEHFDPESQLLDLAAGSGAMSLRMADLGFSVTATDYVKSNFRPSLPFVQADLNGPFLRDYTNTFDAIIASEIIEHLENPRHFAREMFNLLAPGGRLILTTPNVQNPASMAAFVASGNFLWFTENDYADQGHITPITQWQLDKVFAEAGFQFVFRGSYGDASRLKGSPRLAALAWLFSRISRLEKELCGEIYVAVLKKNPAEK